MYSIPNVSIDPFLKAAVFGRSISGRSITVKSAPAFTQSTGTETLTGSINIFIAGSYTVGCLCNQTAGYDAALSYPFAQLYKNTVAIGTLLSWAGGINNTYQYQIFDFSEGDLLEMRAYSGGTINTIENSMKLHSGGYVPNLFP